MGQEKLVSLSCKIFADNASAIKLSINDKISEAAKHMNIDMAQWIVMQSKI